LVRRPTAPSHQSEQDAPSRGMRRRAAGDARAPAGWCRDRRHLLSSRPSLIDGGAEGIRGIYSVLWGETRTHNHTVVASELMNVPLNRPPVPTKSIRPRLGDSCREAAIVRPTRAGFGCQNDECCCSRERSHAASTTSSSRRPAGVGARWRPKEYAALQLRRSTDARARARRSL
jgi:hypothetical protein